MKNKNLIWYKWKLYVHLSMSIEGPSMKMLKSHYSIECFKGKHLTLFFKSLKVPRPLRDSVDRPKVDCADRHLLTSVSTFWSKSNKKKEIGVVWVREQVVKGCIEKGYRTLKYTHSQPFSIFSFKWVQIVFSWTSKMYLTHNHKYSGGPVEQNRIEKSGS